ncbi:MAG: HAD family phosphatase [Gemmatales bacterium]
MKPQRDEHQRGIIWDLDGTLVDSSELHFAAWNQVADERGQPFTMEDFRRTFGRRNPEILGMLFGLEQDHPEQTVLANRKEELFREAVRSQGVKVLPGAKELVQAAATAGFRQAIGSSAPRANIELLTEVAGLRPYLQAIVAMEDCIKGKPDPEVFVKAAGKMGVLPGWCVVIEDAVFGVQAAKAGRCGCVAVRGGGHSTVEDLQAAGADIIVESLTEVKLEQLLRITR